MTDLRRACLERAHLWAEKPAEKLREIIAASERGEEQENDRSAAAADEPDSVRPER